MEEAKKKSQLSLVPLSGVSLDQVYEFYKHVYEHRYKQTYDRALWENRSNRIPDHDSPMFLLRDGVIIGQMGMIRESFSMNNLVYKGGYGFDFIISQEYRGRGHGLILLKGTMIIPDIAVAFNNTSSGPLAQHLGTLDNSRTYYNFLKLNPIKGKNYLPRKSFTFFKNIFANSYYKYGKKAAKNHRDYILEQPNEKSLQAFVRTSFEKENTVFTIRDWDYIRWRVLESPELNHYRIFSLSGDEDNKLLISLKDPESITILMSSDVCNYNAIIRNIASLGYWGIQEGYYSMKYFTTNEELSDQLSQSFRISKVNHPPFQFYSKIPDLLEKLKKATWTFEMINSDFEFM